MKPVIISNHLLIASIVHLLITSLLPYTKEQNLFLSQILWNWNKDILGVYLGFNFNLKHTLLVQQVLLFHEKRTRLNQVSKVPSKVPLSFIIDCTMVEGSWVSLLCMCVIIYFQSRATGLAIRSGTLLTNSVLLTMVPMWTKQYLNATAQQIKLGQACIV